MSTSKKTVDWYNQNAQNYTAHVRNPEDSIYHSYYEKPAMYGELPDLVGKAVLSLGCGSGEDSEYLRSQGAIRSVGIDISEKLVEIARQDHPDCEFEVMDMGELSFLDGSFDHVYSSLALHYLEGGIAGVSLEAFRVLRPGGDFIFSVGNPVGSAMQIITKETDAEERRLGLKKDRANESVEVYGDYATSRMIEVEGDFNIEFWHQPISATLNQLLGAGFILDKMVEIQPAKELHEVSPRHYEMLTKIPKFMLFKVHKQ